MDHSTESNGSKRSRSRSPPLRSRLHKVQRISGDKTSDKRVELGHHHSRPASLRRGGGHSYQDQARINQLQEDERMREWVAQEDSFVLKQAKKKAQIRVKEGRAKPIDWLAVALLSIDPTRTPFDDEVDETELDLMDPEGVFEGLSETQMSDLEKDIDTYLSLETNASNRDCWRMMKVICKDRLQRSTALGPGDRAVSSVSSDIDRLLSPKTYEELEVLESQISRKLNSNEPIDTDYWEQLLKSLLVWKARAKLKNVYQAAIDARMSQLRAQNADDADNLRHRLQPLLEEKLTTDGPRVLPKLTYRKEWDPDPELEIHTEDKKLEVLDESAFLSWVSAERRKATKIGFVPRKPRASETSLWTAEKRQPGEQISVPASRFAKAPPEDFSQATTALYEREAARGFGENEEVFTGEEEVDTISKALWSGKYRPRKPRYFNRVQMGYEWNKYNQTHYDHDNPPPRVVQGYKFNIFYPDLIDKTKAPTYRIEREGGRKKGQSFAPAGEEDTCVIRFMSGPPYEDVAFRIVDKEWDYSAKRERGFKSSFDKGILQLSFQFKKIYYRK